jgi:outer membrane protein TolC
VHVTRASAVRELAESQLIEFQRSLDLAWAGLRTAMGGGPQFPFDIADERLEFRAISLDLSNLVALALSQRPEIRKARLALRNAELEQKLAKAQYCPDVGLFGSYITIHDNANYLNPTNPDIFAGGLQAGVPLFAGGRRVAELRKAEWQAVQARDYIRLLEQTITLEVQKAYLEYKEMAERVPLDADAVRDATETLRLYDSQFAIGDIERKDYPKHFENLITTRLLLSTAQVGYNQHLYAYSLALANLDFVTASHESLLLPNRSEPAVGSLPPSPDKR